MIGYRDEFVEMKCWCWIPIYNWVVIIFVYGVYWLCIFICIYITWKTTQFLKKQLDLLDQEITRQIRSPTTNKNSFGVNSNIHNSHITKINKMIKKLSLYPKTLLVLWTIASITRGYEFIYYQFFLKEDMAPIYRIIKIIFMTIEAIVISGRGIIYMSIYIGKYEKVRKELKRIWIIVKVFILCKKDDYKKDALLDLDCDSINY